MTAASNGSLATGLYWHGGKPAITFAAPDDGETTCPVRIGDVVGWRVHGPRRCTGIWLAGSGRRQMCPHRTVIERAGGQSQCEACAARDPGRALARDATPDDPRTFALYVAWFGGTLLKVGLTATDRGADRLAEQGALAFTWLCHGPLATIRRAEQQASATGIVRERLHRRTKVAAYWRLGDPAIRYDQLAAAHLRLTILLDWPASRTPMPLEVHDQTNLFGLIGPIPVPAQEVTYLADDAVFTGGLVCLAGRDAIIDTNSGPALIDLRLLAGRTLAPEHGRCSGVTFNPLTLTGIRDDDSTQETLF